MLLGYLEFVLLLFIPGAAVIELFQLGGELSLAQRLGLAFGLSMAVDVLLLVVRTSGVLIGSQLLVGIHPGTLYLVLGASAVAWAAPVVFRRKLTFFSSPTRQDLYVLCLVLAQSLMVVAHFAKYPIFPQFSSIDFSQHVYIASGLQTGSLTILPGGILYYGADLLLGSLIALSGDLGLVATQYGMAIFAAFSPLLVYFACLALTQSKRIGLVTTLLYVATGFVWFGSVFDAGLYANFYGILSILLLFGLVPMVLKQPRNPGSWVALFLAIGSGYFSHYSYVTVIPALIALPIAVSISERKLRLTPLAIAGAVVIPGAVAAALRPDLVATVLSFTQASNGGNVLGDTFLSKGLAVWPVLRYSVAEISDDVGAVVALILSIYGVFFAYKRKDPLVWMVLIWLIAILIVAPFGESAWRFSYMALVPLLLFASIGFDGILPSPDERSFKQRSKMRARSEWRRYRWGAAGILFLLLFVNSWSWQLLGNAISNTSESNQSQHGILNAMTWLVQNTTPQDLVVSVTSSYFQYYSVIYDRSAGYDPLATPDEVYAASGTSLQPTFVVLTELGTITLPTPSQNPFLLFPNDTRFQQKYNESGVLIYELPPGN